jgi:hypothetical protein
MFIILIFAVTCMSSMLRWHSRSRILTKQCQSELFDNSVYVPRQFCIRLSLTFKMFPKVAGDTDCVRGWVAGWLWLNLINNVSNYLNCFVRIRLRLCQRSMLDIQVTAKMSIMNIYHYCILKPEDYYCLFLSIYCCSYLHRLLRYG